MPVARDTEACRTVLPTDRFTISQRVLIAHDGDKDGR
jgi:hypothetical protein